MLYVLVKRIVQPNIERKKHQTSVKNAMFMSAKTVSSNIISTVNWKKNMLYGIFAMKVAFSSFYFAFTVFFVNILPVLKPTAFTWWEDWVIAVQANLW